MKVVFIEDVPDVAMAGDTKEVADGYGRNYLLPKKLAVLANSAASNILEAQMKKVAVKRAQLAAEMTELSGRLNGVEVAITAKVGEKNKLYGSITSADIAGELAKLDMTVDKRKIELHDPIKEVGSYDITIRFNQDISAVIKVNVEGEPVIEEKLVAEERKPRAESAEEGEAAEGEAAEEPEAELETAEPETAEAAAPEAEAEVVEAAEAVVAEEPVAEETAEPELAAPSEDLEIAVEEAEAEADKESK
jgi:large subunit ribosomal protein L9